MAQLPLSYTDIVHLLVPLAIEPDEPDPLPPAQPVADMLSGIVCTSAHGFEPPVSTACFQDLVGCVAHAPRQDFAEIAGLLARALGIVVPALHAQDGTGIGRRLRAVPPEPCCLTGLLAALGASSRSRRAERPGDRRRWQTAFRRALVAANAPAVPQLWAEMQEEILLLRYAFGGPACQLTPLYLQLLRQLDGPRHDRAAIETAVTDALIQSLLLRMEPLSAEAGRLRAPLTGLREKRQAGTVDAGRYRSSMRCVFDTLAAGMARAAGQARAQAQAEVVAVSTPPTSSTPPMSPHGAMFNTLGFAPELHGHAASLQEAWCRELAASKAPRNWQGEAAGGIEALWPSALVAMLVDAGARETAWNRPNRLNAVRLQQLRLFGHCLAACGIAAADAQRLRRWLAARLDALLAHLLQTMFGGTGAGSHRIDGASLGSEAGAKAGGA